MILEHESNRQAWSEAARRYAAETDETLAFLRESPSSPCT